MRVKSAARHGGYSLRQHRQVRTGQTEHQLIGQPDGSRCLAAHARQFDSRLQPLGIRKPAHRQRRRSQPNQLQRLDGDGAASGVKLFGAQWWWPQPGPCTCGLAATTGITLRGLAGAAVYCGAAAGRSNEIMGMTVVMAVLAVAVIVTVVMVVPAMPAAGVSPALGLKSRLGLGDDQVHGAQHVGQHMVGFDLQVIRLQFDRHMAVAQVIGGAGQIKRRAVRSARGDDQHRLRRSLHPHQRAVLHQQHITAPHHGATRQKHTQLAPVESVTAKRLFWRTSQSSSTLAERLSNTEAKPRPWGMSFEICNIKYRIR